MKSKPIKSTKTKTTTNPETIISIKQDIIDFQIQTNKLQNKILEKQRKLLELEGIVDNEGGIFNNCSFKDYPDD